MDNLDEVIYKLKRISEGNITNILLPDDVLLDWYEKQIGIIFPSDYRKVLKEVSNVYYGTIELLSVTEDKKYYSELSTVLKDAREKGVPNDWLPICEDNGNYYCLLLDGSIRYWSHDGADGEHWSDLASWINDVWINGN